MYINASIIINVHKIENFSFSLCDYISQNIREEVMVNYLKISAKHEFDKPNFAFKLYSNIVVPNRVDFDWPLGLKRGVVEEI